MRLTLIRHTRVLAQGLCYGRFDPPLAETFAQEAELVRARLASLRQIPFYCSPAQRCRALAAALGVTVVYEARLQEIDFGDWDGRHWRDIPRAQSEPWLADFVNQRPPNGESYAQLSQRVLQFVQVLASRGLAHAGFITHSGVIHAILAHVRGIPLDQSYQKLAVGYGEVVQVEISAANEANHAG